MRLDFEPSPYGGPGASDESDDSADSDASDASSDQSDASAGAQRKRGTNGGKVFKAMAQALRQAAARARRPRLNYNPSKIDYDSCLYLDDVCKKRGKNDYERVLIFFSFVFFPYAEL